MKQPHFSTSLYILFSNFNRGVLVLYRIVCACVCVILFVIHICGYADLPSFLCVAAEKSAFKMWRKPNTYHHPGICVSCRSNTEFTNTCFKKSSKRRFDSHHIAMRNSHKFLCLLVSAVILSPWICAFYLKGQILCPPALVSWTTCLRLMAAGNTKCAP